MGQDQHKMALTKFFLWYTDISKHKSKTFWRL